MLGALKDRKRAYALHLDMITLDNLVVSDGVVDLCFFANKINLYK